MAGAWDSCTMHAMKEDDNGNQEERHANMHFVRDLGKFEAARLGSGTERV